MRRAPDFYFFWERDCPHCKRAYRALSKATRRLTADVEILMYNTDYNKAMRDKYDVRGTPTLVIDKKGYKPISVEGVLTSEGYLGYFDRFFEEWSVY